MPVAIATKEYFRVNEVLNRIFFGGRFKLLPVYLDLEDDLIGEVATLLEIDSKKCVDSIVAATAATLQFEPAQAVYGWHQGQLRAWVELNRFEPPPFTALLVTLALAAERMRADTQYSAQNYYERLFEVLSIADDSQKNRLKFAANQTKDFWEALNYWLAANDFESGRPTAKPVNNWEYAGYALSQALVRKADRQRMHACFAEYGLAPHERLTEGEMAQYLHDWMRGPKPSAWLKRIWGNLDLRPRVSAAACAELETWDGGEEESGDNLQKRRLSWAVSLQTFPAPTVRMYLSAAGDGEDGVPGLRLQHAPSAAAAAAFAGTSNSLWLSPSHDGAITVLEPLGKIVLSPLMLASFALEAPDAGLSFIRTARSVVPLVKLDSGAYFREVSRVSFLRPHLVLCHEKWRERASKLLLATARQGFREWTPQQLRGLPPDWVLFSGVEILRPAEVSDANLSALTPLAEGITIEMMGGLRLSQGIYHCRAAPEITASTPEGRLALRIADVQGKAILQAAPQDSSGRLELSSQEPWPPDTFAIEAQTGTQRRSVQISFRSADTVRPLPPGAPERAYVLNAANPLRAVSAASETPPEGATIQGMIIDAPRARVSAIAELLPVDENAEGEEEPFEPEGDYQLHHVSGLQEACMLRGHHYWIIEDFRRDSDPNASIWAACRDCNLRVLSPPNRGRPRGPGRSQQGGAARRPQGSPEMRARAASVVAPELVYDALCYLNSGSWRRFMDIVADSGANALSHHVWASNLMALGFVDLTYDDNLRSPSNWSVSPPALVFTSPTRAFLSGFRNSSLIGHVRSCLCANGAVMSTTARIQAPDAIFFDGVSAENAAALLASVRDGRGRSVRVLFDTSLRIASAHPPLSVFQKLMAPVGIETADELKRFEARTARWRTAADARSPGIYRANYAGKRYFITGQDGAMHAGPYWLVKLLGAKQTGVKLHGYDLKRGAFQAVLGCGLPPLLERALVASTGALPTIERGKLVYEGVPHDVAAAVLHKLYT